MEAMKYLFNGEFVGVEDALEYLTQKEIDELILSGELTSLIDDALDHQDRVFFMKLTSLLLHKNTAKVL